MLFTAAIFFGLATLSRKIIYAYLGNIILLVAYIAVMTIISDTENLKIAAIFDPFAIITLGEITRYWTASEMNSMTIPFTYTFIINRMIWLGLGLGIFVYTFVRFKFHQTIENKKKAKTYLIDNERAEVLTANIINTNYATQYSWLQNIKLFFSFAWYYFKIIVNEIPFIIITLLGLALLLTGSVNMGTWYGTNVYPVTGMLVEVLNQNFALYILIIVTFYGGELVWRERQIKINQITDALPVKDSIMLLSKTFSLVLVIVSLLLLLMLTGIGIQIYHGYHHYEIGLYLKSMFGLKLLNYTMFIILVMFIHTLIKNKYLGHFAVVVFYIVVFLVFNMIGWEHNLYQYNGKPGYTYSDMNGFGYFMQGYSWFALYWGIFAIILLIVSSLFWQRGTEGGIKMKIKIMKQRLTKPVIISTSLLLLLWILTGSYIFYNTNILNIYRNSDAEELLSVNYEKKYKKYEKILQPKIIGVKANVDIFPYERKLLSKGTMLLHNYSKRPIDSIHININSSLINNGLVVNGVEKPVFIDSVYDYYIYKLNTPMMSGDTIAIEYNFILAPKGFKNSDNGTNLVYNGTFIYNSEICPSIGYDKGMKLQNKDKRKKYKLPPSERMAPVDDSVALQNTYIASDGTWIDYEAVVSTSSDQIAITPGYLQKQWQEGNRSYFHYKMDAKILNFYSFIPAKYQVKKEKWKNVDLEIYYHQGHEYNLERMFTAMKKSLDYYAANFSPFQYKQLRIIEFPRYGTFAQSFPNTIPYSESIGFIAKFDSNDDIDYVFYVTAHEIAHQWWAHQVIGGNTQGTTVMTEALAQYSALMVMEKEYGKTHMQRFLKYELDRYLYGRKMESRKEMPLYLNENQGYIHYNKGSVVMYALRDYIGEDTLNAALARYIKAVAYQQPPFTNSIEFLKYIRQDTPDSLQYVITDMFENITLYSNKVNSATYQKMSDSSYLVKLEVEAHKYIADSLGKETEIDFADYIDIGVLTKQMGNGKQKDKELFLKKYKIKKGVNSFEIMVKEEPKKAGIDVYNKLIDRVSDDNTKTVVQKNA